VAPVLITPALGPWQVQPALLSNGSILLNSRDVGKGHGHRLLSLSTDRGDTFGPARVAQELLDYPSTEGSMIRQAGYLVASNLGESKRDRARNDPCQRPPAVSPCALRHNLTIHVSTTDGATWRPLGSVWAGPAAYSSLASLPWRPDAVGVLFESGMTLRPNATAAEAALAPYARLAFTTVPLKSDDSPYVVEKHLPFTNWRTLPVRLLVRSLTRGKRSASCRPRWDQGGQQLLDHDWSSLS
jgi:hypothetical protein